MKTKIRILTLLVWLLSLGQLNCQTMSSVCFIHTVNSQNDKYFLRTIPYDNIAETPIGKTIVFDSDSSPIYEIPRYFERDENRNELFLSNDGSTIVHVIDYEFEFDENFYKSIQIFRNGIDYRQYSLTELIDCDYDYEDCFLFCEVAIDKITWEKRRRIEYRTDATEFERQITKKSTYLDHDTLFIFTHKNKLIKLDLNTTELKVESFADLNLEWINQIKPTNIKSERFEPVTSRLPNLSNGNKLEAELADLLDMAVLPDDQKYLDNYKRYSIRLYMLLDSLGDASKVLINNDHGLPESKILSYIESNKFETISIPKETGKWIFRGWIELMNKSEEESLREREIEKIAEEEEYKKQIVADSIDGLYIPKNIEECFLELNKILKPKEIHAIKELKDKSDTILYHHGLGTWLRNNWRLWGGSRLQQYLLKKGIVEADHMSSTILEFYYDWLNGHHDEWSNFELK